MKFGNKNWLAIKNDKCDTKTANGTNNLKIIMFLDTVTDDWQTTLKLTFKPFLSPIQKTHYS